jgi:hypothetical protein
MKNIHLSKRGKILLVVIVASLFSVLSYIVIGIAIKSTLVLMDIKATEYLNWRGNGNTITIKEVEVPVVKAAEVEAQIKSEIERSLK